MGSPISGILAELKLRDLKAKILDNESGKIKTWLRYVDDVFAVIKGGENPEEILKEMNELDNNIKFTLEMEEGNHKLP